MVTVTDGWDGLCRRIRRRRFPHVAGKTVQGVAPASLPLLLFPFFLLTLIPPLFLLAPWMLLLLLRLRRLRHRHTPIRSVWGVLDGSSIILLLLLLRIRLLRA